MNCPDELIAELKQPGWMINEDRMKALIARLEAAEPLIEFVAHDPECIRSFWEAGEPTEGDGYRSKYKGVWYQSKPVDETPKCTCGLDDLCSAWLKVCGR